LISSASHHHSPELSTLLEHFQIVIVPVANPDGYEYSMTKDRLWRKTRSKNGTGDNGICMGADANRNWGYRWAGKGRGHILETKQKNIVQSLQQRVALPGILVPAYFPDGRLSANLKYVEFMTIWSID
jgi:murein tripeptide amidase MpaA